MTYFILMRNITMLASFITFTCNFYMQICKLRLAFKIFFKKNLCILFRTYSA